MATFGEEIKKLRLERNLSVRETARRSDVSHAYLSQLENNRRKIPTLEILLNISNGLRVCEKEIMDLGGYDKARQDGLMKSADLYREYRQKKNTDLKDCYKANRFDIEELLSYDTTLLYRSTILSKNDKDK